MSFNCISALVRNNKSRINGEQITINLQDHAVPSILSFQELRVIIGSVIEDVRSPSDNVPFNDRSEYNRQWRFYGSDENGDGGADQLERICRILKSKESDRRLLLVARNPTDPKTSSLAQFLLHFYVADEHLSCKIFQSSAKLGNVLRYDSCRAAILTYMLCHLLGLHPGSLVHSFGSLFIEENEKQHINKRFSKLKIHGNRSGLEQFQIGDFELCSRENGPVLSNCTYIEHDEYHEEMQYLNLIASCIKDGSTLMDRTKVGTRSIFGPQMKFSLRNGTLPLITTKRVFTRGVLEELLWFLRGSTNSNELAAKNVHFWDANGSKDFLTNAGLGHREEGDLGPVYGFQWRHFGAKYVDMHRDYKNQGVDQIARVIESLKTNPNSDDHVVLAWNAHDIHLMALPPCHTLMQFFVEDGELSCKLYQRAGDMGLGVPFNLASYAFLTHMIAHVTGLKTGFFYHSLGDTHVYLNHIEPLKIQLTRHPKEFPTLRFKRKIARIEDFDITDFIVDNYKPDAKIAMEMAV